MRRFGDALLIVGALALIRETSALLGATPERSLLGMRGIFAEREPERLEQSRSVMRRVLDDVLDRLLLRSEELREDEFSWLTMMVDGKRDLKRAEIRRARLESTVKVWRTEAVKIAIAFLCFILLTNAARILRAAKSTATRVLYMSVVVWMGLVLFAAIVHSSVKRFVLRNYHLARTQLCSVFASISRSQVRPDTLEARKVAHRKYVEGLESYMRHSTILVENRFRSIQKRLAKYPQVENAVAILGERVKRATEIGWEAEEELVRVMGGIEEAIEAEEMEEEEMEELIKRCVEHARAFETDRSSDH